MLNSVVLMFVNVFFKFKPDIQDKIRLEIQDMLEANGGQMTYESVVGMEYLGMVISGMYARVLFSMNMQITSFYM